MSLEKTAMSDSERQRGAVYLVGAGPGDPDLLTVRALRLIQRADVIVHDHLVAPEILDLAGSEVQRIYAGKERGDHTMSQGQINALLVRLASEGKRVVRLKGGDPLIFGRGGEEAEALAENGVSFEIVPGITAASGVSAYAGIPLTHRNYASSCILVAGHLKEGRMDLDWRALARPDQTVVVYMGLLGLPTLCRELIAHGCSPATPAVVVQRGTTSQQRVVEGTLETLPQQVRQARIVPPTLIIIGEVVRLRHKLDWFDPARERPAATISAARDEAEAPNEVPPQTRLPRRARSD
jgi:uroporphyrin-III C-methyltransferase / precorrin-2 dehydrogenase / sirohydrochlorin ferrochelatase